MASLAADGSSNVVQHFWGAILGGKGGKEKLMLSLTQTELQITQATLVGDGKATLYARTPEVDTLPLCVLGPAPLPRSALLDLNFFPEDGSVLLSVLGDAAISIAGTVATIGVLPESSESDKGPAQEEEGEEEEEGDEDEDDDDDEEEEEEEDEEEEGEEEEEEKEQQQQKQQQKPQSSAKATSVDPGKRKREGEGLEESLSLSKKQATNPGAPAAAAATAAAGAQAAPKKQAWRAVPNTQNKVQYRDLAVGKGAEAGKGSRVTVAYKGTLKSGKEFDAAPKFKFKLLQGEVIKGWDLGVFGMREGGKRELVIHPDYGCASHTHAARRARAATNKHQAPPPLSP
jgi:FKBP-type peptidyl-prolyl cis-trans isomerase